MWRRKTLGGLSSKALGGWDGFLQHNKIAPYIQYQIINCLLAHLYAGCAFATIKAQVHFHHEVIKLGFAACFAYHGLLR